ncbi:hypothetical protein D1BOALGB6SA_2527 [Olavius sp. associated proteobacterium Delta 1]|nr:hypothetical protein D1BOALGB6SA_2527 [Olavius sp. associated proteobacterium Delta 1]
MYIDLDRVSGMKKTSNYLDEIDKKLEQLKKELRDIKYRNIDTYGIMKIPIWMLLRARYLLPHQTVRSKFKEFLWFIKELTRLIIYKKGCSNLSSNEPRKHVIFILDHDQPTFLKMQFDLMKKFDCESLTIITFDKGLYPRNKSQFKNVYYTGEFEQTIHLTLSHLKTALKFIREIPIIRKENLLFKLRCCRDLLIAMKWIDFYHNYLDINAHKAIVTLSDLHCHENVITNVGNIKGVKTFSLQHGLVSANDIPVSSDRIFVWGEKTKRELVKYDVPEEKVVVAGYPSLDKILRKYSEKKEIIKQSYFKQYSQGVKKPIVTYIAGNFGPDEESKLFESFLSISDLDILPVVKLKATLGNKQIELYKQRIRRLPHKHNICLRINSDLHEILTATDILVGFVSSVVVEALPFSVICVVLDLFDYIDLKTMLPHYSDCQVVHNDRELRELIGRIISDPGYCSMLKNNSLSNSKKYFNNSIDGDASQIIHDYINAFVEKSNDL